MQLKGYYTVRAKAADLSQPERMALETQYARALEVALGGLARTTELCLTAAEEGNRGSAKARLESASEVAMASVRAALQVPDDCHFSIEAWRAQDL